MKKIEISPRTMVFAVFFLLSLYIIWQVKELVYSLFIAFIIMSALKPPVKNLELKKVPHSLAVVLVYISFILLFILLFSLVIPPIMIEITGLIRNLPYIIQQVSPLVGQWLDINSLSKYIPDVTNQIFTIAGNVLSNFVFIVSTLFFGFYFLLEESLIEKFLNKFIDKTKTQSIISALERSEKRMNSWFWGELMLMTVVGVLTFIGLNLIGMKYALALAVLAGLLEVIPNLGPVLSAVPAFLIGLTISSFMGYSTLALYFIVQQLENNIIVPIVMNKAVGLTPILTLMALIVGGKLGGVVGVLLAIPAYLFLETLVMEVAKSKTLDEYFR